ncbi:MAG: GTP 3',8-cyclase MoaA [Crocinitomicaceae bacterium]|nr:GTP 3',8-cyclase MoaA [Crocinitomicaceae bacterium]MBK8926926.1 GTP 3',8-cyclase MoaA [Crocinitomicaceae bacterium]
MQNQTKHITTITTITDQFGRVHDYLRISLTERCNLRCFYCMPEEGIPLREKSEFMSAEETVAIATRFVQMGVKKIRLTGGEPLIKKNFRSILADLSKLPIELAITTNGILVDEYIDDFKAAGLKNVNVSLDSLQREKFEKISRRNYYDRIMSNIQLLVREGFNTKINAVVMRGVNDDEIVDFIKWTKDFPVQVRFIEFMPFDGNNWNWEKKVSLREILDAVRTEFGIEELEALPAKNHDTTKNFRIKNFAGSFGVISSVTNPFCDSCNRIRLTADGRIKNCLFSQTETDLLSALRSNQDITPMIVDAILNKKKERGGIDSFQNPESIQKLSANRTMTSIGG